MRFWSAACAMLAATSILTMAGCGLNNAAVPASVVAPGAATTATAPMTVAASMGVGRVGSPYNGVASVSGGKPAYRWAVSSGQLPDGLQLAADTGILSGTPTATGTASFQLTVTDSSTEQQKSSEAVSITIAPSVSPLTAAVALLPGTAGSAYAATATAAGGTPGYSWTVAAGELPAGLTLDRATGALTGVPSGAGAYTFTLQVQDSSSPTQTVSVPASMAIASAPSQTTWYVRVDGGTRFSSNVPSGQCDGMTDAPYPGNGTNQHCAFNDIRLLWQDGSYAYDTSTFPARGWIGKGGDTYLVHGSIASGAAPWRIGWSDVAGSGADMALVAAGNPAPTRGWRGDAYQGPPPPPAGTAALHTRILGESWQSCHAAGARTPIIAGYSSSYAFQLNSSYVDFQCFDISDKSECKSNCTAADDFARVGLVLSSTATNLLIEDVRIHGMRNFGIFGPSGDGTVMRYLSLVGNGEGGWNADPSDGSTGSGSLLVQHYEIKWNGCMEQFPLRNALPYQSCTDQNSAGYGDGFGTATVLSKPGWQAHFDQGEVAYNTQDGLDALHLIGNGSSMTVTRTLAYGNMGQQVKIGGAQGTLEDSIVVGNCSAMAGAIPGTPDGYNAQLSDFCRAGSQAIAMTVGHGTTTAIRHNTIAAAGYLLIGYLCDGTGGACDGTALVDLRDNVLLGNNSADRGAPGANFLMVQDSTYTSAAACKAAPGGHRSWTTDGMTGCNNDVFYNTGSFNDHNVYYGVKDACTDHNGTANLCLSPGLVSEVVPAYGLPDVSLAARGGGAFHAGAALSAVPADYRGAAFDAMPSIGALEKGSTPAPYRGTE